MDKVIFTNCGLLGDMFLCLPVISWYYKTYGIKSIFGVSKHFNYSETAEEILSMQECIDKVIYFDWIPENYQCGAQPYRINNNAFTEEYKDYTIYSLGFHRWPDKYIPEFYAEEYNLGVDYDFTLNYGDIDYTYKDKDVKVDKYESPQIEFVDAELLDINNGIVKNLQYAAGAKSIITFTTGFSIMATLARIPVIIWQRRELIEHHKMYFDINNGIIERFLEDVR